MDDVIQCPNCSKKYRLKGTPPPTFQCRNCGTVMDLSAFGAAPAAPEAPAAAPPPPPAGGGPVAQKGAAPARRRGGGGRRGGGYGSARIRRTRHAQPDQDQYDDEDERPHYRAKKQNNTLLWGSLAAAVVAVILLVVFMSNQKEPEEKEKEVVKVPTYVPDPDPEPVEIPEPVKRAPKVPKARADETRPELREGTLENIPIPEGKRKYVASRAEIKAYPWPEYVSAEDRSQIEKWIEDLEWGGADMYDAMDGLVAMDVRSEDAKLKPGDEFRAVGRVITEFKNLMEKYNNDLGDPELLGRMMTLDKILRKIDGMQERDFADREGIRAQSTDTHVKTVVKRWNWWYDLEKWRLRREPWDERDDLADPESMEGGDEWEDE